MLKLLEEICSEQEEELFPPGGKECDLFELI
jgi:hypothetical protein